MKILILLPHQLFDKKYFPEDIEEVILYEHPQYFTKYKFNKKKLVLHRASMKCYADELKKTFKIKYIEYNKKLVLKKSNEYLIFDPIDKISPSIKAEEIETPNFLLKKTDYEKYREKTDKFMFTPFYMFSKKINGLIPNVKSTDKMNRQKMPKNVKVPNLLSNSLKDDKKYIDEAVKYVNKNFKNNYGNTDNFQFPISHKVAEKWLHDFLKNKLAKFGDYQDFIYDNEPYLLHSCLSTSINIGLINPLEIIKELEKYKNKVAINSFEGYLRQLYWREYQRYTYIYCDFSGNYFGYKKKIDSTWYTGDTGMEPVDNFIKMGFDTGYLHHIIRLMIMGNYMNLYGLSPKDGFRWFMEFSCDSYEWVMSQNVLDMVFFVTGGKTMRKPYISSSNYIIKMSNYKKGEWSEEWDKMYRKFMEDRLDKLWKFRYSFPALKKIKEGK